MEDQFLSFVISQVPTLWLGSVAAEVSLGGSAHQPAEHLNKNLSKPVAVTVIGVLAQNGGAYSLSLLLPHCTAPYLIMRHVESPRVLGQSFRQSLEAGVAAVHAGPERRLVARRGHARQLHLVVATALGRARRHNALWWRGKGLEMYSAFELEGG